MEYISTRNTKKNFSFKDVFLKGLATDGGLFIPKTIPKYSLDELTKLKNLNYKELAAEIILKYCGDEFSESEIKELLNRSYKNFRTKNIVKIQQFKNIYLLELFHGPTLAFKDIAMQIIGNMYEKILEKNNTKVNIVVATSGDTGAAAIDAIKDRENMKIFVLHPDKKISDVQRKFMTTVRSKNVFNIAVDGNFDDCQKIVKSMFANKDFSNSINMSGVNSINLSRIIFQTIYYFFSYFQVAETNEKINFSVPTGNFGNIYAGYIAKKMGLPIDKLIIATNQNDILKRVVSTGVYKPSKVKHTLSPSMDIQVASNFERLVFDICSYDPDRIIRLMQELNEKKEFKLKEQEIQKIKENFCSESVNENETKLIIKELYESQNALIDPHTAVGFCASKKISLKGKIVVLSTAHPSKFFEIVLKETGVKPELPDGLKKILDKEEKFEKLPNNIQIIKNYILKKI